MKKLLSYALPFVAAASITSCKPEFPAATIKKVFSGEIEGNDTKCMYTQEGRLIFTMQCKDCLSLELIIKIQDPDKIDSYKSNWGSRTEDVGCKYEAKNHFNMGGPAYYFRENPLKYTVTDCKGNVKDYTFTLDDLTKQSSPLRTIETKGQECPKKVNTIDDDLFLSIFLGTID